MRVAAGAVVSWGCAVGKHKVKEEKRRSGKGECMVLWVYTCLSICNSLETIISTRWKKWISKLNYENVLRIASMILENTQLLAILNHIQILKLLFLKC